MTELASGLTLGLAGSLHCLLMCGPIAVLMRGRALSRPPVGLRASWEHIRLAVSYHGSRIVTYGLLGLAAGWTGRAAFARFGSWLSLGCGVLVLIAAIGHRAGSSAWSRGLVTQLVVPALGWSFRIGAGRRLTASAAAGALNGLLPCGMVYVALTAALAAADPWRALVFMLGFGLGTLPFLSAVWIAGAKHGRTEVARRRWLRPAAIALLGVLLIGRGWVALSADWSSQHSVAAPMHVH